MFPDLFPIESSLLFPCHASHDALNLNNCCRFRACLTRIRFNSMSPPVFLLSQQARFHSPSSRSSIHSSPWQLGSRFRTTRRRLSVSVVVGVVYTERKLIGARISVVAMAAWPRGWLPPPGVGKAALSFMELSFAVLGPVLAFREVNGDNTRYSKFASEGKKKKKEKEAMVASKTGMFLIYFPAALLASVFLACRLEILPLAAFLESAFGASGAAAFWENALVADADDHRLVLVAAAMFVHFSKRVLEVLFVHNYSGSICFADSAQIAVNYAMQVCLLLYSQLLSAAGAGPAPAAALPFPNQLLKWLGVALFLIGVTGNAYHHWLLSHLRKDHGNSKEQEQKQKQKQYVVPQGGLFGLLVCPHYVFEMVDMAGIALISQTLFGVSMVWFVSWYLTGRALASKKWYVKKVEGFPEERSVLIPGIF